MRSYAVVETVRIRRHNADDPVGKGDRVLYVFRTATRRLQPIRRGGDIEFLTHETRPSKVGVISCDIDAQNDEELFIEYFGVEKDFRGQGYGREMAEWVERYAWRRGMQQIALVAHDSAIAFWSKMGFTLHSRFDMVKARHHKGHRCTFRNNM
jgi:GNAT superfamily N-acetyltransferase